MVTATCACIGSTKWEPKPEYVNLNIDGAGLDTMFKRNDDYCSVFKTIAAYMIDQIIDLHLRLLEYRILKDVPPWKVETLQIIA